MPIASKGKLILLSLILVFSIYFSVFFHELGHYIAGLQLNCKSDISVELNPINSSGGCDQESWNFLGSGQKAHIAIFGPIFTLVLGAFSFLFLIIKKKLDYKIFYILLCLTIINFWVLFYNSAHTIIYSGLNWNNSDFDIVSAGYQINQIFFLIPTAVFLLILMLLISKFYKKLKFELLGL